MEKLWFVCNKLDAECVGKDVAKKYGISSYPTLLFINVTVEIVLKSYINSPKAKFRMKRGNHQI